MKVKTLILVAMASATLVACNISPNDTSTTRLARCAGATFMMNNGERNSLTAEWHQLLVTDIKKNQYNIDDYSANRLAIKSIDTSINEFKKHQYTYHNLEQFYIKKCNTRN